MELGKVIAPRRHWFVNISSHYTLIAAPENTEPALLSPKGRCGSVNKDDIMDYNQLKAH
jgi:hypothetical protein